MNQPETESKPATGAELAPPRRLGPYRIENRLGVGGMGAVYRAWDERLERWVALKCVRSQDITDPSARESFRLEAHAVAQLSHPSIVPIFDILEQEGHDWIVMEYVEGSTLAELVRRRALSLDQVLLIGRDIAAGLSEAHAKGIIHCDLKTENVLVTAAGRARILDFGLARRLRSGEASAEGRPALQGTARAMSPEQVRSEELDHRSDLFSLGVLLFEGLSGSSPFLAKTQLETLSRITRSGHPPIRQLRPQVPKPVARLIDRLLAKARQDRPQSAGEVVTALDEIVGPVVREIPAPALPVPLEDSSKVVLATLVASELVGSPPLPATLRRHDRVVRDLLAQHSGRALDPTRGTLLLFERPSDALAWALEYLAALDRLAAETGEQLVARQAVQLGEFLLQPGTSVPEGFGARLTTRLMTLAREGQILLTRTAFDLARQASGELAKVGELSWLAHGSYLFEGFDEPVEIFEVGRRGRAPLAAPSDTQTVRRLVGQAVIPGWRPAPGLPVPQRRNWIVERKLAEGGIGEVWLARHRTTSDPRVFKFCYDEESLRSLKREITLFRLLKEELGDRRDINRLLDWSFEEAPYFIESEYTAAGSLFDWSVAQQGIDRVPLEQRLELVAQVAEALAAAHSVGVLHKDVKPANILIAVENGVPRCQLTDFGIGRLTDQSRLEEVGITLLGGNPAPTELPTGATGTRLYMAPELLEGKAATLQADIYALGVVLYQMVIGDLTRALAPGWERDVQDDLLRADIAAAVDGTPQLRIGNALRLAERLRSLPERRQRARAERAKRLAAERDRKAVQRLRRRWQWVGTIAAVLLVFAVVLVVAERQRAAEAQRAQRQALAASQVSGFLVQMFELLDPLGDGEAVTAPEVLERGVRRVRWEFREEPRIQGQLLDVIGNIYLDLSLLDEAAETLEDALELRREAVGEEHEEFAASLLSLARLREGQSDYETAETHFREALELYQRLLGERSWEVAAAQHGLAGTLQLRGRYDEARPLYESALELRRRIFGEVHPRVAESFNALGGLLHEVGEYKEASPLYREALALRRNLLDPDHPQLAESVTNLASLHYDLGQYTEAEPLFREAVQKFAKLGEDHGLLAIALSNLAATLRRQGDYQGAETQYREILAMRHRIYGDEHQKIATTLNSLATVLRRQGRYDGAAELFERALAMRERLLGPEHPLVAVTLLGLGGVDHDRGGLELAETRYRRALEIVRPALGNDHAMTGNVLDGLARVLQARGEAGAARELFEQALAIHRAALGEEHPNVTSVTLGLALALSDLGDPAAVDRAEQALDQARRRHPAGHWEVADAETVLATCLLAEDRTGEAEPLLQAAYGFLLEDQGPNAPATRTAQRQLMELLRRTGREEQADRYRLEARKMPAASGDAAG